MQAYHQNQFIIINTLLFSVFYFAAQWTIPKKKINWINELFQIFNFPRCEHKQFIN
jgi:hypothetical protein